MIYDSGSLYRERPQNSTNRENRQKGVRRVRRLIMYSTLVKLGNEALNQRTDLKSLEKQIEKMGGLTQKEEDRVKPLVKKIVEHNISYSRPGSALNPFEEDYILAGRLLSFFKYTKEDVSEFRRDAQRGLEIITAKGANLDRINEFRKSFHLDTKEDDKIVIDSLKMLINNGEYQQFKGKPKKFLGNGNINTGVILSICKLVSSSDFSADQIALLKKEALEIIKALKQVNDTTVTPEVVSAFNITKEDLAQLG